MKGVSEMVTVFSGDTADAAWLAAAHSFARGAGTAQAGRGGPTAEILHACFSVSDPRQRWVVSRVPALNVAFAIAETAWIVAGRRDLGFLEFWNRRFRLYSGAASQLHGAYGFRLRSHFGLDQLERAAAALAANPDTRQVVLQLWDGRKHQYHLALLKQMMDDEVPQRVVGASSLERVYNLFRDYPGVGRFLAYQYAVDLNYSTMINFDENDFVVAGPGAEDGIRKCFPDRAGWAAEEIIRWTTDNQEEEFCRRGIDFSSLWGRRLHLIDCQNLFCEVGKYARVSNPEVRGSSGRTRIKQRYRPTPEPLTCWYPPKWGINHLVSGTPQAQSPL